MTREQHEGAAGGRIDERECRVDDRGHELRGARLRHRLRQVKQALPLMIEGAPDGERRALADAEAAGEMAELIAKRQRRRSEDPGAAARLDEPAKTRRDVEGHETQRDAARGDLERARTVE